MSIEAVIWPGERSVEDLWMGFVSEYHNKYQTGGLQHLLAAQIRQEVGDNVFRSYFKFAFVRNPWDRAVSQYAYMRTRPDLRAFIGMGEEDEFKKYLELIQKREHVQWMPQHRFIFGGHGERLVNYLGRFEHLERDAAYALARIGLTGAAIPHLNASSRRPLSAYYDREATEMVAQLYADDIRIFGYAPPPLAGG